MIRSLSSKNRSSVAVIAEISRSGSYPQIPAFNEQNMVSYLLVGILVCAVSLATAFRGVPRFVTSTARFMGNPVEDDGTFVERLPSLLKRGAADSRPDPDIASSLRQRFKTMEDTKRKTAQVLKTSNPELAAELEELADEMLETSEKFTAAAQTWDAWGRPDPELAAQLRAQAELSAVKGTKSDPNFVAHLPDLMKKGVSDDRPTPDLPSELRLLKVGSKITCARLFARETVPSPMPPMPPLPPTVQEYGRG